MRFKLKARLICVWRIVQLGHGFSCGRLKEGTDLKATDLEAVRSQD